MKHTRIERRIAHTAATTPWVRLVGIAVSWLTTITLAFAVGILMDTDRSRLTIEQTDRLDNMTLILSAFMFVALIIAACLTFEDDHA